MKNNMNYVLLLMLLMPFTAMAGGLVTNTNQSASFIRKPVQDAVIDATGTYYNPAGLAFLEDGFHLSLSNQTISQTRTINSTFPGLNRTEFEGAVSAPLFPTVYAVYKTGALAFSFGVNPIGGGGSANFEEGLPSFEQQVAILPGMLTAAGIPTSAYTMNAAFDGSSLNWGIQLNTSYAINEIVSVSLGLRYILANNSYTGHLRDIMINPAQPAFGLNYDGSNMVSAPQFFTDAAMTLTGWAQGATAFHAGLQPIIDEGYGTVPLDHGTSVGLTTNQIIQIQSLIMASGQNPGGIDIATAQMILGVAGPGFEQNAQIMQANAAATVNRELDASQSGTGIAPVFGLNLRFSDQLNMAIKYEHKASITMTNSTRIDDVGMYPDGAETANDMPAMLSAGISYRPTRPLTLSAGIHYYFDKNADYGKSRPNDEIIDNNFIELGFGAEYYIGNGFSLSAGYLRTQTGVNEAYHSDLSHSLSTNSIGLGGKYNVNPNLAFNLGFMNTTYESHTKAFEGGYQETYERVARTIAIGIDLKF